MSDDIDGDDTAGIYYREGIQPTGPGPAEMLRRIRARVDRDFGGSEAGRLLREAIVRGATDAEAGREPRW